jgi:hypothetical protein
MFGLGKITPKKILKAGLIRSQNLKHRLAIAVILFMSTVLATQVVYAAGRTHGISETLAG